MIDGMCSSKNRPITINLQERDVAILRGLFESRVMTTAHIAALHFTGRTEMAKKRLQKLSASDLIAQRPRKLFEPAVHFIARGGLIVLRDRGVLCEYPQFAPACLERRARVSDMTLRHELEMVDVKLAFHRAAESAGASVVEFTTWPLLIEFETSRAGFPDSTVRPDGFARIIMPNAGDTPSTHSFYIELDRSTEVQATLIERANGYLDHYRSGGFANHNGGKREDYRNYPFRVLYVLKTAERRNITIERLLLNHPPILTQIWLTTYAEVIANPYGAIWVTPIDYRACLAGSAFDISHRAPQWGYRRQSERDAFVQAHVSKQALFRSGSNLHP